LALQRLDLRDHPQLGDEHRLLFFFRLQRLDLRDHPQLGDEHRQRGF
jgi:hypothetical protein